MWEKIKNYVMVFLVGLVAGILILLKIKAANDSNDIVQDALLQQEGQLVDSEILAKTEELDNLEVPDLTDQEIADYWKNL